MSLALPFLAFTLPLLVSAADNGMDMSMDDGMTLATGTMMTTLHFSRGDTLWFTGWVPQSAGAVAGACIGLFILALVDRWIAAVRAMMEIHWRAAGELARGANLKAGDADEVKGKKRMLGLRLRVPPFIPAHDIMRGAIHALQATLGFAFMLAVMTFQAAFIISIALGLGVGEMLFGRHAASAAIH
ncbi:CTR copper uptake transporter [Mycena latifolia]|nr:CTR copper uptake transporter [Mycena latifolia]KAJ7448317.1 CTR copper uptake transporter [Mycena latifolia]